MIIDWGVVSSAATAVGSLVTALGVGFGAWQIKVGKEQAQATFEDSLDQQYRSLSMELPVSVLIGEPVEESDRNQVRELIYNYLDLSNEQVYLRAKGRISKHTWTSWSQGIKLHLAKPSFAEVYSEIKDKCDFTYLNRLVASDFQSDPKSWYR
ncbi:hypothetical protein KO525_14355 [Psychrosphaera sp. B3R10]|uniref:Uncharacterized protein n=1 Tax=Psychrosphaera algicola TaxID=3023714 RepID=A0ABT5FE53_9GAMM|nr:MULTISPECIES: hypothetical protein [unclassified Psychrosphaera]MBU2883339.1 hypothetical protein [Psychrosphaera sp. I2R16]MBU2990567.1 hypothetical protein [Psychrosphaera sp. B3R10]MDC2889818.1 hypothetical protein [Psychrosphaera sp. G1-22]MDO6718959.1 hypothetical protein [Psychrosphaera sp. 1_MG-2023]